MPASANFFRPAAETLRIGPRLPRIVANMLEVNCHAAPPISFTTIDAQRNRTFCVIRAWSARNVLAHRLWMFWGETVEEHIWTDLAELIATPICGRPLQL